MAEIAALILVACIALAIIDLADRGSARYGPRRLVVSEWPPDPLQLPETAGAVAPPVSPVRPPPVAPEGRTPPQSAAKADHRHVVGGWRFMRSEDGLDDGKQEVGR